MHNNDIGLDHTKTLRLQLQQCTIDERSSSSYFAFAQTEAPPSMAEPDWSQLPTELLQLISQKLNSEFYLLRFRSVCSTWRSSIPNYPPNHHLPFKLPVPIGNDSICYLVKHNIFFMKPTTITNPHQPQQIHQPLLIRIGPNINGKTHLWHPLNLNENLPFHFPDEVVVFDFNHISIVDLGHVFVLKTSIENDPYPHVHYDKVVAATSPGERQPHFVTHDFSRAPCMFRPGDDGWMEIPGLSSCLFGDICNFKGRMCVADDVGKTVMVGSDLSVDLVAAKLCFGRFRLCVVESELLLVDTTSCDSGAWMDVYRLDEKKKKWGMLSNLGDR
ncbi:F-box protein, partial [Trifolium medium]|nr:F-box protein [Trifolium medium]